MGMDRNTVIGFVLIGALLIAMFVINSRSNQAYLAEQKRVEDSIAAVKAKADSISRKADAPKLDSLEKRKQQLPGAFITDSSGVERFDTLENELVRVVLTSKGGQPKQVELKNFRNAEGKPVVLGKGGFNKLSYTFNAKDNGALETGNILFSISGKQNNADKSGSISYTLQDTTGKQLVHTYSLAPGSYMLDLKISVSGADKLFTNNAMNLFWQTETDKAENDLHYERMQTHICYLENGNYDFENLGSGDDKNFEKPVDWLAVKQQFFVSAIVAKNKMQSAIVKWTVPADSLKIVAQTTASCRIAISGGAVTEIPLQLYYGPSDYNVLSKYNNKMENIVPYGSGIFAFVKYINRYFLLPIFDFLREHIASMGIVILILTLIIRLITSPILYKSYLSGAKMKALKPEVDLLKAKFTDSKTGQLDQQGFGMEQMKLWKSAGVSPLGGCLPALLQIPIFMSLYYFFQSNISLRGESFLWAKDLAAYDSIWTFGHVPLLSTLYGDHISLFTITATLTSLIISIYSMSSMQDNTNPVMKYMPYIFPILLLGIFNNLPSALTWYYTVSNTITLILQIIIQKYIINHEKILAQIEENRKKPVKPNKFQERLQAMQETQKKLQEMKKTGK